MEEINEKKSKKQDKQRRKKSCLSCIFSCVSENDEKEDSDSSSSNDNSVVELHSTHSRTEITYEEEEKNSEMSVESKQQSISCMTDPESSTYEISVQKTDKSVSTEDLQDCIDEMTKTQNQRLEQITRRSPFTATTTVNTENKDLTDQLVRTILGKYLAMRSTEQINSLPDEEKPLVSEKAEPLEKAVIKTDALQIEFFDKTETDNNTNQNNKSSESNVNSSSWEDNEEFPKPKGHFPAKTKSAPTNSAAHDSLADICTKYSHYNHQENNSDESSVENLNYKKKLELVFDKSSEEILSCDDSSTMPLQYTISCENTPVYTGIHRQDSVVLHKFERKYEHMKEVRTRSTIRSQEVRIQPSAMGEFNGYTDSTTSLKWKLIISHHKDLK